MAFQIKATAFAKIRSQAKIWYIWEVGFGRGIKSIGRMAESEVRVKCYMVSWATPQMPELPLINRKRAVRFCQEGK